MLIAYPGEVKSREARINGAALYQISMFSVRVLLGVLLTDRMHDLAFGDQVPPIVSQLQQHTILKGHVVKDLQFLFALSLSPL